MAAIDTIAVSSSGVTNAQKSASGKGQTGDGAANGLFGLITALLQKMGPAQNAQTPPAAPNAADPAQDLLAKIAALLQKSGDKIDLQALQQLLPPDVAQALAKQMAVAQNQPFQPTLLGDAPQAQVAPQAPAGLTSDLSAQAAGTLQQQHAAEQPADPLLAELAAQLNALEPGTAAETPAPADVDATAVLLALQAEAPAPIDTLSPLAQQAATAQAAALRASTSSKTTDAGATPPAPLAADAASGEPRDGSARGITPAADTSTANGSGKTAANAQLMGSAATQAAQAAQAATPQAKAEGPAHPAVINSMLGAGLGSLSGDSAGGFGGGEGFGQQNAAFSQAGGTAYGAGADVAVKTASGQPAFINYLSGTRQSPTTQMVGLQMSRNAASQVDTFTMQLDPADLGRLEVRMSFDRDGKMSAKLIAEKPETLHMLQRDSAQLERVLQQSGVDVGDNALSFDLREGNQQSLYEGANRGEDSPYAGRGDHALDDNALTAQIAVEAAGYISQSGVNIMV